MSIHLHASRQWTTWMLAAFSLGPFALCFASSEPEDAQPSPVTGRVTIAGRPAHDMTICLDANGGHAAFGSLGPDGTFRLANLRWIEGGAQPGRYHAHLYSLASGVEIPSNYRDPRTSGIVIDIAADWNEFQIDLP